MILTHRIQLIPSLSQVQSFVKACGVARYTYNWALAQANQHYQEHGKNISISTFSKSSGTKLSLFGCLTCNHTEDRDVNAAKNLRNLATKPKHFTVPPARGKLTLVDKTALAPRLDPGLSDQPIEPWKQTSLVETRTHSLVETG